MATTVYVYEELPPLDPNNTEGRYCQCGSCRPTVYIPARSWVGCFKEGGIAIVKKRNDDGTVNVKFVLGRKEKNLDCRYVFCADSDGTRVERSNYKDHGNSEHANIFYSDKPDLVQQVADLESELKENAPKRKPAQNKEIIKRRKVTYPMKSRKNDQELPENQVFTGSKVTEISESKCSGNRIILDSNLAEISKPKSRDKVQKSSKNQAILGTNMARISKPKSKNGMEKFSGDQLDLSSKLAEVSKATSADNEEQTLENRFVRSLNLAEISKPTSKKHRPKISKNQNVLGSSLDEISMLKFKDKNGQKSARTRIIGSALNDISNQKTNETLMNADLTKGKNSIQKSPQKENCMKSKKQEICEETLNIFSSTLLEMFYQCPQATLSNLLEKINQSTGLNRHFTVDDALLVLKELDSQNKVFLIEDKNDFIIHQI